MEECSLTKEIKTETSIEEHFENEKIIDEDGIKKELLLDEEPVGGKGLSSLESELPDEECIKTEIEEIEEKPSYDQLKSEIEDTVDRAIAGPSGCDKKDISAHCSVKDESDYEMNEELEIKNDSDSDDSSLEHNFSDDEEDSMQSEEGMQTRADAMGSEEWNGKILKGNAYSKNEDFKSNSTKKLDVVREHKCKYCDFATRFIYKLKEHSLEIHHKNPFECDLCDYSSNTKWCLQKHLSTSHFKCAQCNYMTTRHSYLERHIDSVHSDKKRYACNSCKFAEKTEFKCDLCLFRSFKYSGLRTHILFAHLKSKNIKCPHCDYGATANDLLKYHIETVHWEKKEYDSPFAKSSGEHPSTTYKVLIPKKTYQRK